MRAHRYRLPLAVAAGVAAVGLATLLIRPRAGLIEPVPVEPQAYFSAEQLERAREFRGPQRLLAVGGLLLSGVALAVLALRPPAAFRRLSERAGRRPLLGGAAVGAGIAVTLALVVLPLGAVAHARAVDVGLSTQGFGGWLLDRAKAAGISAAFAGGWGLLAVALVRRFPRRWWMPGGAAVVVAGVVLVYLSPVLLDPIFNRFKPLPAGELRSDVLELAERAGVEVGEVYRVDASRRTTGLNAYVGGLGETKRVVLYDNLIEDVPQAQLRSVVAHELAHVAHRDVVKGLVWLAIVALPSMLVVQRLTERIDRSGSRGRAAGPVLSGSRGRVGAAARGAPAVLPAIALSLGLVSFVVQVAGNWLSRKVEARADAFALELTEQPRAFLALQRSLAVRNVSDPEPPAVVHAVFGTHPTTVERIGFALRWAEEHP